MSRLIMILAGGGLLAGAIFYALTDRPQVGAKASSPKPVVEASATITLGAIAPSPKDEHARLQPLADYLAARLQPQGLRAGSVVIASTFSQMADLMREGKVDLLIDSPFPIAKVRELADARPFLRRWKKGASEYHSLVFSKTDGQVRSLDDLKGKMIAFEDAHSTSGYLLPKAALVQAGLQLVEYADPASPVPADRVGYVFAKADSNTVIWVLRDRVAAGATSNLDLAEQAGDREGELRILAETPAVPRQMVAHRASYDPAMVAAVRGVFTRMDADDEGRGVLQAFDKTTKFDALPADSDAVLETIAGLANLVAGDLPR